ncbi:hypothetical protein ONZ51_g5064 [Trametes cubensis]|uniref:Uncharacterized protein n=1 Tax=Trametes cubensis TaxID=1111947 RepID=A0AAD7X9Q9_9APHY|nr:hypothetical protein ONZ51_g5064 [Trametes cubensis]
MHTAMKSAKKDIREQAPRAEHPSSRQTNISSTARKSGTSDPLRGAADPQPVRVRPRADPVARPQPARVVKQTGWQARQPAPRLPIAAQQDSAQDAAAPRKVARKMASAVPLTRKQPQSSFNYIAPLLRSPSRSVKTPPSKPMHLLLRFKGPSRAPRKNAEDDIFELGTNSVPRTSAGAMSVQRRAGISPRKVVGPSREPRPAPRVPSRAVASHAVHEIPSSSSDESSGDREPPRVRVVKAARKTTFPQTSIKSARKRAASAEQLARTLGKAARKLNIVSSDEEDEIIELSSDVGEDTNELIEAFDALTLGTLRLMQRKRLPFLPRNLRVGFQHRCIQADVRTGPKESPLIPVKVVYRYYPDGLDDGDDVLVDDDDFQEWTGTMTRWCCPLCQLHKPFNTRAMLQYHLTCDHREVKVSWSERKHRDGRQWCITLILPDHDELNESTSEESEDDEDEDEQRVKDQIRDTANAHSVSRSPRWSASTLPSNIRNPLFLPGSDDEDSPTPITPPHLPEAVEELSATGEEIKPKQLMDEPGTPEDIKPQNLESLQERRPDISTSIRASYRGMLPPRYPSPPPPTDPLGPAAQYPYLWKAGDEESEQAPYSCRIGGPRIFDLLNELPLDEFGVMSWAVVDREEELFEMDDVRDEDKVMLALWNRWIMLNNSKFIFNDYSKGVHQFLDKYWPIIHKAAGWRALRAFLLMMNANHYFPMKKVLDALKYYEEKTGMKLWYREEEDGA